MKNRMIYIWRLIIKGMNQIINQTKADQLNVIFERTYGDLYVASPHKSVEGAVNVWCTEHVCTGALIKHMKEYGFRLRNIKIIDIEETKLIAMFEPKEGTDQ